MFIEKLHLFQSFESIHELQAQIWFVFGNYKHFLKPFYVKIIAVHIKYKKISLRELQNINPRNAQDKSTFLHHSQKKKELQRILPMNLFLHKSFLRVISTCLVYDSLRSKFLRC